MKKSISIILLLIVSISTQAQDSVKYMKPYAVNYPAIATIIGVGSGISDYGLYRIFTKKGLTVEQVSLLSPNDVNRFDRPGTRFYSNGVLQANRAVMLTTLAAPMFLFIQKDVRKSAGVVVLMYMEAMTVTDVVQSMTAGFVNRNRPYTYNANAPMDVRTGTRARSSFFAQIPLYTSTASIFGAKVYADFNPHSKWRPLVWTAAGTAIVTSDLLSFFSGDAYVTDILMANAIGIAAGYLVPYFKLKLAEKKQMKLEKM